MGFEKKVNKSVPTILKFKYQNFDNDFELLGQKIMDQSIKISLCKTSYNIYYVNL